RGGSPSGARATRGKRGSRRSSRSAPPRGATPDRDPARFGIRDGFLTVTVHHAILLSERREQARCDLQVPCRDGVASVALDGDAVLATAQAQGNVEAAACV